MSNPTLPPPSDDELKVLRRKARILDEMINQWTTLEDDPNPCYTCFAQMHWMVPKISVLREPFGDRFSRKLDSISRALGLT